VPDAMKIFATGPGGPESEFDPLRAADHEVLLGRPTYDFPDQPYTEEELIELTRERDVLMPAFRDRVTAAPMELARRLRMIIVPFIGVNRIDVDAATRHGIVVCNSPRPENFVAVAEATIGLILMLMKRVKHNEAKLRAGGWRAASDFGDFLFGKTVGLIGLGRIGSHVARRLQPWDVRVLACDPYVDDVHFKAVGAIRADLETLLRESDIVSMHVVVTPETRRMIGGKQLEMMKRTAFFVNTARGDVVHEAALARALAEGRIAGAALDVFEVEPLPAASPLRTLDPQRVILTPHDVGQSESSRRANLAMAIETVLALGRGELREGCVVNPDVLPKWHARWG
jgi:D-3-phosphoglycerate dehydrogenase